MPADLTPARLDELRALCDAAARTRAVTDALPSLIEMDDTAENHAAVGATWDAEDAMRDAAIANMPALLDEVVRLRAEVARLDGDETGVLRLPGGAPAGDPGHGKGEWGWWLERRVTIAHGWARTEADARADAARVSAR